MGPVRPSNRALVWVVDGIRSSFCKLASSPASFEERGLWHARLLTRGHCGDIVSGSGSTNGWTRACKREGRFPYLVETRGHGSQRYREYGRYGQAAGLVFQGDRGRWRIEHGAAYASASSAEAVVEPAPGGFSQAAAIKQLRERTGAPIVEVKRVLVDCDWDTDSAYTELRKKGLIAVSKKAKRVSAEGLLGLHVQDGEQRVAVVEINSETDFVPRNERFKCLVSQTAKEALELDSWHCSKPSEGHVTEVSQEELGAVKIGPTLSTTISEAVAEVAAVTGENVKLRHAFVMRTDEGLIAQYLHNVSGPGMAQMIGLVALSAEGDVVEKTALRTFGQKLAMHVVASRPQSLSIQDIKEETLKQERHILQSQAAASGKPASVIEKIVEGRLRKFYEDVVFLEQKFVMDETKTVKAVIQEASKDLGAPIHVHAVARFQCGEGIERENKDFAAEVAAQAQGCS